MSIWQLSVHIIFLTFLFLFLKTILDTLKMELADGSRVAPPAYLVVYPKFSAAAPARVIPLRDEIRLGRGHDNDVVLDDPFVSAHHARIYRQGGTYRVEDLGSTNRTYVNGELLNGSQPLKNGAIITIGASVVAFQTSPISREEKGDA